MAYLTYSDAVEHLVDYLGGSNQSTVLRDCRRSVLAAYDELAEAHRWSYYFRHGRVVTSANYDSGSVLVTMAGASWSGSTYDRLCRLDDASITAGHAWPPWAAEGYLRVGTQSWRVRERLDAHALILDEEVNPGQDAPAGTAYSLYRDSYTLPEDFISVDQALYESNFGGMQYVHPREWLLGNRYTYQTGTPQFYTLREDQSLPGRWCISVCPFPTESKTVDFLYRRRPRPLRVESLPLGTATVASGSNLLTVSSPVLAATHAGAVVRLAATSADVPSLSPIGDTPFAFESVIGRVVSPTAALLSDSSADALSGVYCLLSDYVDIEYHKLKTAFQRCCEKHLGMSRSLKDKPSAAAQYREALEVARCSDSVSTKPRREGQRDYFGQRLRDMPFTWEIQ